MVRLRGAVAKARGERVAQAASRHDTGAVADADVVALNFMSGEGGGGTRDVRDGSAFASQRGRRRRRGRAPTATRKRLVGLASRVVGGQGTRKARSPTSSATRRSQRRRRGPGMPCARHLGLAVAAADAVHLVDVLPRLLTPCTRCCWRCCCGGTCGTACCFCSSSALQRSSRWRRRTRCTGSTSCPTAVGAVHVVLLAVLLRGQVWAGVLLFRVVQVRVGVLLWLFEHAAVQSFGVDS